MNVEAARAAHQALLKSGVNFVACLPDSAFQELYVPLSADPEITYVQVASENDGVGVCMGAWLGGMKPALLVENTGFTLGTYALLRGPMAFGVPMLLLISHRGDLGDERWFSVPFGWGTKPLLDLRFVHQLNEFANLFGRRLWCSRVLCECRKRRGQCRPEAARVDARRGQ